MAAKKKAKTELKDNEVVHPKLNDGMKFEVPDWSYGKHKRVVKKLAQFEENNKNASDSDKNRKLENFIIIESLAEADVEISEEIIDNLHPNDRMELYAKCYMAGRKGTKGDVGKKDSPTTSSSK